MVKYLSIVLTTTTVDWETKNTKILFIWQKEKILPLVLHTKIAYWLSIYIYICKNLFFILQLKTRKTWCLTGTPCPQQEHLGSQGQGQVKQKYTPNPSIMWHKIQEIKATFKCTYLIFLNHDAVSIKIFTFCLIKF